MTGGEATEASLAREVLSNSGNSKIRVRDQQPLLGMTEGLSKIELRNATLQSLADARAVNTERPTREEKKLEGTVTSNRPYNTQIPASIPPFEERDQATRWEKQRQH
jgi:hypothetical protein